MQVGDGAVTAVPIPRIRLTGIRKRFGSIEALRGVDLELFPGEVLGLVGDNAAGKSTLTKIVAGAYVPDAGSIELDGTAVAFATPAEARAKKIEMVYQDLSLCDTIDVAGNLFLGREPKRSVLGLRLLDQRRMLEEAKLHLDALEIHIPNLRALVAQLSGGQRQSIAIGRAAAFEPRVLIMDEPTSALAVAEVEAVLRLIRRLAERGVGDRADHPPAAGSVPGLRPHRRHVRGQQGRGAADRRDRPRGSGGPDRRREGQVAAGVGVSADARELRRTPAAGFRHG